MKDEKAREAIKLLIHLLNTEFQLITKQKGNLTPREFQQMVLRGDAYNKITALLIEE